MRRFLFPLAVGFLFSSLLIYLFGDSGIVAYRAMTAYRESLRANVGSLVSLNDRLKGELDGLQEDPWKLEVLAGKLGLYREGDRIIRLEGAVAGPVTYEVGNLLKLSGRKVTRNPMFKAAGLGIAVLIGIFSLAAARSRRKREHGAFRGKP